MHRISEIKLGGNLTSSQRISRLFLLVKHFAAFQWDEESIGLTNLMEHHIPTGDHVPITQLSIPDPYQCSGAFESPSIRHTLQGLYSRVIWCLEITSFIDPEGR